MRYIGLLFIFIFIIGCQKGYQDEDNKAHFNQSNIKLFGNMNNKIHLVENKEAILDKKIKMKELETKAKIEIAKINSKSQVEVTKLKTTASTTVAQTDANARITTTKIDAQALKEKTKITMYTAGAFIVVLIIGFIFLFLNSKKNRELKQMLHAQDMEFKHKELEEKRVHKMLDLIANDKVGPELQKEILLSMTKQKESIELIENKSTDLSN